jgi:hypothetical protein
MNDLIKIAALNLLDIYGNLRFLSSKEGIKSASKLYRLKDRYQGKRCFIIGNGPSLKKTDLTLLRDEYTFGLNRIYLLFEDLGYETTFLVSVNKHVIRQFHKDLESFNSSKFFSWKNREHIKKRNNTHFIRSRYKPGFSKNPLFGVWEGATVTFVAMQLAYYFGFKRVILVGVDHSFKSEGEAHELIKSQGKDKNHFSPDYFGKGVNWQLPDLETSELAYKMAKDSFEKDNREIVDATLGGKLRVFPRVDYKKVTG